jgi:hypothetical protein
VVTCISLSVILFSHKIKECWYTAIKNATRVLVFCGDMQLPVIIFSHKITECWYTAIKNTTRVLVF